MIAAALSPPAAQSGEDDTYEYVGTKKCRMCHTAQYKSLLESPKARSWDALKPGVSPLVKEKAGLDASRDYTTDGRCLECHAVGYGKPGGYVIPKPDDRRSQRLAQQRQGVGCEACHGPGSGFVEIMKDIYRNERKYDPAELWAVGRKIVTREVCMRCHNTKAICMVGESGAVTGEKDDSWLHVDVTDRKGFHAKFPFKYRQSQKEGSPGG